MKKRYSEKVYKAIRNNKKHKKNIMISKNCVKDIKLYKKGLMV